MHWHYSCRSSPVGSQMSQVLELRYIRWLNLTGWQQLTACQDSLSGKQAIIFTWPESQLKRLHIYVLRVNLFAARPALYRSDDPHVCTILGFIMCLPTFRYRNIICWSIESIECSFKDMWCFEPIRTYPLATDNTGRKGKNARACFKSGREFTARAISELASSLANKVVRSPWASGWSRNWEFDSEW